MMDFESDDEELPTNLDLTTHSTDLGDKTASTFQSSALTDRTVLMQEPPSPGTARKRTNEEVYEKPQRPTSIASTTPQKSPPGVSFQERTRPDPKRAPQSRFEEIGFASLHAARAEKMSTSTTENAPMPDGSEKELKPGPNTFVQDIAAYQQCLVAEFQDYENELKSRDRSQELAALDWQDLEERYQKEIGPKIAEEQEIMNEFQARFSQFMLWMQVSSQRESERASKRLRTRVAFVQNSENQLASRQDHYGKVLAAFQNAMALLGNA